MAAGGSATEGQSQFNNLLLNWRQRFTAWVVKRIPPARHFVLDHQNIFILPNRQGLAFLFVVCLMFVGAVNYEANLAFALVFLLLAMFLLSIFHTFRNLSGLHVSAVPGAPVFAGGKAEITVILNRHGSRTYESVQLAFPGTRKRLTDLIDLHEQRVNLYLDAPRRGRYQPGRLVIETVFPFGICRAWSLADLEISILVYPRPVECDLEWLLASHQGSGNSVLSRGNDDFHALRAYQLGDSLKHVAWKTFARGQGMYTKEYASNVDDQIWLDWDMFAHMEIEDRLSRLCYCVLQLDTSGRAYGLRLPGVVLPPARGNSHRVLMLETLALYGLSGQD